MRSNRLIADLTKQFKNLSWTDEIISDDLIPDDLNWEVVIVEGQAYVIKRRRIGGQTRYFVSSSLGKQGSSLKFIGKDIAIFDLRLGDGVRIDKRYFVLLLPSLDVISLEKFFADEKIRENLKRWVELRRSKKL